MKIKINIEKKHLYYLTGLISLIIIELVIGYGWSSEMPYHEILYTDRITGKSGTTITLDDSLVEVVKDLVVTGDLTIEGEMIIEGDEYGMKTLSSYNTGDWADGNTLDPSMGVHKFCFLTQIAFDDIEFGGAATYSCEVEGSFNGNWIIKAYSQDGAFADTQVYCSASCVD